MKRFLYCAISLLLAACGRPALERTVDVKDAAPVELEAVAGGWELLPLDESETPLGAVSLVKRYGERTFVACRRSHQIYIYDGTALTGVLNAYGRGPGEYRDMEDFAYREETSELLVNDRTLPGFRIYQVPEMSWVRDEKLEFYVGTFEVLDATHSIFSIEPEEEEGSPRFVVWDHDAGAPSASLETSFLEAELGTELPMTRDADGSVLFGLPGATTRIRRASAAGFETVAEIALVPDAFGPAVWEEQDFEKLFTAWNAVMEGSKPVAVGAAAPLIREDRVAFWYNTGYGSKFPFSLAISTPDGSRACSELRIEGYPEPVQLVGTARMQWCSCLQLALLEDVPSPKGKLYPCLRELAAQGYETALLIWNVF